jgi:hypothetical protein
VPLRETGGSDGRWGYRPIQRESARAFQPVGLLLFRVLGLPQARVARAFSAVDWMWAPGNGKAKTGQATTNCGDPLRCGDKRVASGRDDECGGKNKGQDRRCIGEPWPRSGCENDRRAKTTYGDSESKSARDDGREGAWAKIGVSLTTWRLNLPKTPFFTL